AALAALGANRSYAVWPAILSALGAVATIGLMALILLDDMPLPAAEALPTSFGREIAISLLLGAVFAALGFVFLRRHGNRDPKLASLWAVFMSAVPVALATISFLNFGLLARDWTHGLYGLALGAVLLAAAQWRLRVTQDGVFDWPGNLIALGSFA